MVEFATLQITWGCLIAIFAIHRPRTRVDSPRTNLIHLRQPARGIIFHRFVTLPRRKETVHLS